MKYMLLINNTREDWEELTTWSHSDIATMGDHMRAVIKDLEASGEYLGGEGLGGPARMKVVQARTGAEPLITDGPMAEAKELLAGYFAIDVASEERALEIAARVSSAPGKGGAPSNSPIEVHPVMEGPETDPGLLAPYRTQ